MESTEQQLADVLAALNDAPCALMQTKDDGAFTRVNGTFCKWIGYSSEQLVGRRRLQDLLTMGGRMFHQTHWLPLLQIQGSVAEVKLEFVKADGSKFPMMLNAIRRERNGALVHELAGSMALDRDKYERELVLSRRKLEAAVADAQLAQAQARDRAVVAEQLMGIVSHDLRNPLSTIQMGALLLDRTGATPDQRIVLARITRATDRAHRLITDLLDFTQARLGSGLNVERKPIDLHAMANDVLDELAQAFPGRALLHEKQGEGSCNADPHRLAQLISNLVGNAMAYGDKNKAVTVRSHFGDGALELSVHNWGEPIAEHMLGSIFEPLARGTHANNESGSVGLGLYIVEQIAKAHGGKLCVVSTAETGTTFTAHLPCN